MNVKTNVWRNMQVFDGLQTLPHRMAITADISTGKIIGLARESDYQPDIKAQLAGENFLITPGFIDCHTHIIYAGSRSSEFEQCLEGVSYEEIAKAGGGILSTVNATRNASVDELLAVSLPRLDALINEGVTSLEIKSGYGLTLEDELKILKVARKMEKLRKVRIITTLLAAHAIPPEYKNNSDAYVEHICEEIIPAAVADNLADAVDVFCEKIAFNLEQCERIFQTAKKYHLPVKMHAEQLSNLGGSVLAAKYQALSVDHVEYLDEEGIKAIKESETVAVLLPGAFYMLRETQKPPIDMLRKYQIPLAIATDANPGSSPIFSPTLMLNMACTLFGLTPTESLQGFTTNAARALNLHKHNIGRIAVNQQADFCVWNVEAAAELCYAVQANRLKQRVFAGVADAI